MLDIPWQASSTNHIIHLRDITTFPTFANIHQTIKQPTNVMNGSWPPTQAPRPVRAFINNHQQTIQKNMIQSESAASGLFWSTSIRMQFTTICCFVQLCSIGGCDLHKYPFGDVCGNDCKPYSNKDFACYFCWREKLSGPPRISCRPLMACEPSTAADVA